MELIHPEGIRANGHYSPAVRTGNLVFVSGQLPIRNGKVVEGMREQLLQAMENTLAVLRSAGLNKDSVVLCHVYLSDIGLWDEANEAYSEFFGDHKPARVIVPSGRLHFGALVEIETVAEAGT